MPRDPTPEELLVSATNWQRSIEQATVNRRIWQRTIEQATVNRRICILAAYEAGVTAIDIAEALGLSRQRVYQLLDGE